MLKRGIGESAVCPKQAGRRKSWWERKRLLHSKLDARAGLGITRVVCFDLQDQEIAKREPFEVEFKRVEW